MKIKICGFTDRKSLKIAIKYKIDFAGFVFVLSSKRYVSPQNAALISKNLKIKKVAVFQNHSFEEISAVLKIFKVDFIQLHGNETLSLIDKIKDNFDTKIIKGISVKNYNSLEQVSIFEKYVDIFLFDSNKGGSGKEFDWKIMKELDLKHSWFLSGGINISNIDLAFKTINPPMIDLSSGVEMQKGLKCPNLIKDFLLKAKSLR